MEILGRVHNGVVVFDDGANLPEGTRVSIVPVRPEKPRIECAPGQLPLVHGGVQVSIDFTNDRIYEILDEHDVEVLKCQWNVPT